MFSKQLPPEIFLNVKTLIPLSDVRTHVCFYKSHPTIAALYDCEVKADLFWRRVCWYSGICALRKDDPDNPHFWRDIAIEVIDADGFCTHPQCGESLLAYNRRRMERASEFVEPLKAYSEWKDEEDEWDASDSGGNPHIYMHRVMTHIGFRPLPSDMYYGVCEDAQLRRLTEAEVQYKGSVLLKDHPLILRSFATSVPSARLQLDQIASRELKHGEIRRWSGVTVFDVVKAIYLELDEEFDNLEKANLVDMDLGWDDDEVFSSDISLRDVLASCQIYEFSFDGTVVNGMPFFCTSLQQL
ncbi:hypothetical protein PYCCODRAFT_1362259 [Trametes coccinea BRFM310]|uniref:Uncharacterized protein n=1 Tax=Trametes coccinea (strain BRFM310) TaxID=1353009 RepID=A0A1Y2IZK8_TRAC3|nr:hypothetical protein PYCCODRAFT_1362259 [Trametes coccinea BRFM310]